MMLPDVPRSCHAARTCVLPLPHHPHPHHQMATFKEAEDLMNELTTVARPVSVNEDATLRAFARNATGDSSLQLKWWDNAYWAERQKEAKFRMNQEELRQYLPLPSVKAGLFQVRGRLRGGVEPGWGLAYNAQTGGLHAPQALDIAAESTELSSTPTMSLNRQQCLVLTAHCLLLLLLLLRCAAGKPSVWRHRQAVCREAAQVAPRC